MNKRTLMVYAAIAAFLAPIATPLTVLAQDNGRPSARGDRGGGDRGGGGGEGRRQGYNGPDRGGDSGAARRGGGYRAAQERDQPARPDTGEPRTRPSRPAQDRDQGQGPRRDQAQRPDRPNAPARPDRPSRPDWNGQNQGQNQGRGQGQNRPGAGRPDGNAQRPNRPDRPDRNNSNRPDRDRPGWNNDRRDGNRDWDRNQDRNRPGWNNDRQDRNRPGWNNNRSNGRWDRNNDRDRREYRQRFNRDQWRRDWNRRHARTDWWRNDNRFRGWSGVRIGFYFAPGWGYYSVPRQYWGHRFYEGQYLPSIFWRYEVQDYSWWGLPWPPAGTTWVYVDNNFYLIDLYDGYIIDVIHDAWRW